MTTFASQSDSGTRLVAKRDLQNRLFAALSAMFAKEVPLYDKALLVNMACNRTVCALLSKLHLGFSLSVEDLERTSGERHGAIRIGRPDEYRLIGRLFACFAMEPHNFYDMTCVGAKSQPIIATAFRSTLRPEHRVFSSVLMTDYFDPATRARIEALLAKRTVFSDRAKQLIEKSERQGGLEASDADDLIRECTERIFKWTGSARDHALYKELSAAGFKIAADIACFQSHHLNHLTPNTFSIDLYTAAMKHCLGEVDAGWFRARAETALGRLVTQADHDSMKLHFKHVPLEEIAAYKKGSVTPAEVAALAAELTATFAGADYALSQLKHAGFKDFTEGPSEDTPLLLRQDAYKALTEPVRFTEDDGTVVDTTHTARFGEIEERFYACTPAGRALYDACLAEADAAREKDPSLPKRDMASYEALYAKPFAPFAKNLEGLIRQSYVYARYLPTEKGLAAAKSDALASTDRQGCDLIELAKQGFVEYEGLRYEDFLPVSAAGIFASNLQQYGTKSTAAVKSTYSQSLLEEILGKRIIDATVVYAGVEAESKLDTYAKLGLLGKIPASERTELESRLAAYRAI
jgi:uncharacterized glyoxalase superfamily metalloenzyme YdcJ